MTSEEFNAILEREVSALPTELIAVYHRYAVTPFRASRFVGQSAQPTFVLARAADHVLYYDDIEGEFGIATLIDGIIRDGGTWGERLEWALRHFPLPKSD